MRCVSKNYSTRLTDLLREVINENQCICSLELRNENEPGFEWISVFFKREKKKDLVLFGDAYNRLLNKTKNN